MASDIKYFDSENFETQWAGSTETQQMLIVEQAGTLGPGKGIAPALEGYASPSTRISARAASVLETLVRKVGPMTAPLEDGSLPPQGTAVSPGVCARIYGRLVSLADQDKKAFLLGLLAEMDGMGPAAAFTAIAGGHLPPHTLERMKPPISEAARLGLTGQYIQATPDVRLSLSPLFTRMLGSVKTRSHVITFFARLFDRGQDTDPFLHNIRPELREPSSILTKEIASADLEQKIMGLKALSMVSDRIPATCLQAFLTKDTAPRLRMVVYRIIRNATPGTYAGLFDPVLALLPRMADAESRAAAKALAASGKHPLHRFLDIIHQHCPHLEPGIREEAGNLSKTGFLFLQDMALCPDRYISGIHRDINTACIFGMVKKRPERVAALLRNLAGRHQALRKDEVKTFLAHIKGLLDREKKDIAADFRPARPQPGTAVIRHRDFSDSDISGNPQAFKGTVFHHCRFSHAALTGISFERSELIGTNLSGASFESVTFDASLWINVTASGTVFRNCRFICARICNTGFQNTTFIDCFFAGAHLASTDFARADICFSSFAQARLSAVSLNNARVLCVDFSHVRARFTRFPSPDQVAAASCGIDYNARRFQPEPGAVPPFDEAVTRRINMLIFCEFTHYGQEKFLKQNRLSLLTALDIFEPKPSDLFRMVPALLHTNQPFAPMGKVPEQTPCGIADYTPSRHTLDLLAAYTDAPPPPPPALPAILGLFTIGSVGSVAQTSDSDIDYWVCVRESDFGPGQRRLLEQKLALMEEMAHLYFHTQVTFFIVDINRVKANDFGDSTMESSGSAQAGLLKEEFYRTMIHLAGKLPLWAVLPTAVSRRHYAAVALRVCPPTPACRYLDLGDIHEIPHGEYFGASVWQMFKWIKSPFKSVLKMALLEKYFFESEKSILLCNQYKTGWMNAGTRLKLAQNDAYYFLVKHLVRFYQGQEDPHSVNLLLTCFFLKLGISDTRELDQSPFGIRRVLLLKCLESWGWEMKKVREVGSIKAWPYKNILRLSRALEAYIIQKYKRVTQACREKGILETMISPEDRTVLEHKVKIEFSRQPMKVRKVLLVSRGDSHFTRLYLQCRSPHPPWGSWVLINESRDGKDELIYQADTIEEIGAWLAVNGLFSDQTRIRLLSSPFPVTEQGVHDLFSSISDFFSPRLSTPVPFDQLLAYPDKKAVFSSVNFYAPRTARAVTHYTALYINGWNEVFCRSGHAPQGFISMAHVKRDIMFKLRMPRLPEQTVFFFKHQA